MTKFSPIPTPVQPLAATPAHLALTFRLTDVSSDLLVRHVRLLRDCVAVARKRWGFSIEAAVVLPNELQLLCGFPDAEFGVNGAVDLIRSGFCRHLPPTLAPVWAQEIEALKIAIPVVAMRRTFMENAPVRAGLVGKAEDWPFSSAHKDVSQASDLGVAVA